MNACPKFLGILMKLCKEARLPELLHVGNNVIDRSEAQGRR